MNLRPAIAEFVGTAFLLLAIVGSGIMAQRICGGNVGLALLANAIATAGALCALILAYGSFSGAHFNPAVTLAAAMREKNWTNVVPYVLAQLLGACTGTMLANLMFGMPAILASHHERAGSAMLASEFVATFGLLAVVWGCARTRPAATPFAVAAYIAGGYWFTPSTAFANPAVTIARSLTDSFSGIRPQDVAPFVVIQIAGGLSATLLFTWLGSQTTHGAVVARVEAA